jgi:ribonuclease HI
MASPATHDRSGRVDRNTPARPIPRESITPRSITQMLQSLRPSPNSIINRIRSPLTPRRLTDLPSATTARPPSGVLHPRPLHRTHRPRSPCPPPRTHSKHKDPERAEINYLRTYSASDLLFVQQNCNKSTVVNREIREILTQAKTTQFIVFMTEPGVMTRDNMKSVACTPTTNNVFHHLSPAGTPRAALVADTSQITFLLSEFTSNDVVTVLWDVSSHTHSSQTNHGRMGPNPISPRQNLSTPAAARRNIDNFPAHHTQHTLRITKTPRGTGQNNSLLSSTLPDNTPQEVILCSVYWDAALKLDFPPELINALEDAYDKHRPIILCGDFNAHHELWGSPVSDTRGEAILELCTKYDLSLLNDGTTPTYRRNIGSRNNYADVTSHIDLTLVSNNILHRFEGWRVGPHFTYSDHARIYFRVPVTPPKITPARNLRKADWSNYGFHVHNYLADHPIPELWDETTIESQLLLLKEAITAGLDEVAPLKNPKAHTKGRFNDPELKSIIKKLRRLKNQRARKRWSEDKQERLRNLRHKYKKRIKQIDTEHWREFVSEHKDEKGAAQLMKSIRKPAKVPPTLLRANGTYTSSIADTAALLLNVHFPGNAEVLPDLEESLLTDITLSPMSTLEPLEWITHDRVYAALRTFSNFKACGPDEIKPVMLKHLEYDEIDRLKHIFTASIQFGYIPIGWRKSRTVFIPKPGKSDYSLPKSFRPISLTSFLFKTMERLALWHLEETAFREKPIHEQQHAFRKDHSTELALTEVVDHIEQAVLNKRVTMAVFLDIEGAFDNLNTEAALKAMETHGIPPNIRTWYGTYLRQRTSMIELGHETHQRLLTKGTPQGGVLSPVLWNLAFDSLLSLFDKHPVRIFGYADDACLLASHRSPDYLTPLLQDAINKCLGWGQANGLNFSATKTVAMIFSKQHISPTTYLPLYMGGKAIKYSEETRYLGVIMDRRLTWRPHIQSKIVNAKKLLFKMRNALGVTWGLDPHLIRWIYTGIVRPAISYGALVWAHAINRTWQREQFKTLHGTLLRMLGPVRRHTPIAAMELIAHIIPLPLFIKQEACKSFLRLYEQMTHSWSGIGYRTQSQGHRYALQEIISNMDLPNLTWDDTSSRINLSHGYNIIESSFEQGLDHTEPNSIMCYTDGSKQDKEIWVPNPDPEEIADIRKTIYGIGSGFATYHHHQPEEKPVMIHEKCFSHCEYNTVFQAEMSAIHQAALYLRQTYSEGDVYKFVILSDSQSALRALGKTWTSSILLQKCVDALNDLSTIAEVDLRWIKAHVNHIGNEHADSLAKSGAVKHFPDVVLHIEPLDVDLPAPVSYRHKMIHENTNKLWAEEWTNDPRFRQSKLFYREPNKLRAYRLLRSTKKQIGLMIQFLTGHGFLRRHLNLLDVESGKDPPTDPACRLCGGFEETPIHFITECSALQLSSRKIFRYSSTTQPLNWSIDRLCTFLRLDQVSRLHEPDDDTDLSVHISQMTPSSRLDSTIRHLCTTQKRQQAAPSRGTFTPCSRFLPNQTPGQVGSPRTSTPIPRPKPRRLNL